MDNYIKRKGDFQSTTVKRPICKMLSFAKMRGKMWSGFWALLFPRTRFSLAFYVRIAEDGGWTTNEGKDKPPIFRRSSNNFFQFTFKKLQIGAKIMGKAKE